MLPPRDRLPILQQAGQTDTVLERISGGTRARPLPISRDEMLDRGWDAVDVVFVSGDAYVDHPSFAAAILGRVLEAAGFEWPFYRNPIGEVVIPGKHSVGRGSFLL